MQRLVNETKQLLSCGGAGGHMSHAYDVLSPSRFIGFINDLLKGRTEAYEKVDGANLIVGINKFGRVVYARSKKATPELDIEKKFPLQHPGSDAFRAGFRAIQKAFKRLSEADKKKFGLDKYFLNVEIIFGFIPNIIPYSETKNFIVFHNYVNPGPDYEPVDFEGNLNGLAAKIGQVAVVSKSINYIGTPSNPDRVISDRTSVWEFRGPIKVSPDEIKQGLQPVLKAWKSIPEIQLLRHEKNQEIQLELMRTIADKIGSIILAKMVSKLSGTAKLKFPKEHPRIEGLVVKYRKGLDRETLLKITGNFRELNKELWAPLREELDPLMKSFNIFILDNIFGIRGISRFASRTLEKYHSTDELFRERSTKKLEMPFNKNKIDTKIDETVNKLEAIWRHHKGDKSVKAEDVKKALLINGYKLKKLKYNINKADNLGNAFKAYMINMMGWNKV